MPKILHHGAVEGVTGSCHQLFLDPHTSVLIDCGMFQGAELSDHRLESDAIDFSLAGVEALFVTHCHIDHVGRIPWLLAAGFEGPIFATEATAKLLPLVLADAIKVGISNRQDIIEPLMRRVKNQLVALPYDQWTNQSEHGIRARFRVAGHILGSAYIEFDVDGHIAVFSGDLGAPHTPLLPAPKSPYKADTLVLESTYGDRIHEDRKARRQNLQFVIERALRDTGTVLIPAFSIGRTQELLYELEDIIHTSHSLLWDTLHVVVDSPLAAEFTDQYRELTSLWDKEAKRKRLNGRHPLAFNNLTTVDSHSDHLRLVNYLKSSGRPAIVIAASGMCAGGRIVNYLKALLSDPRTDVLFVGFQAKGTPGRDIQKYGPRGGYVELDGERYDIRASVHTIGGYSAHADQNNLLNFVKRMRHKPSQIRLVHGDPDARQSLAAKLVRLCPDAEVLIPGRLTRYE